MANENVIELTDTNFTEQALKSPVPVLVDFTAVWCAPCRMIAPTIDALATEYAGRVRVGKCDVDENSALAANLDVRAMPTLMMFKNGEVVGQIVGAAPRAKIEALVTKALGV
jgi:thioredoxin 1